MKLYYLTATQYALSSIALRRLKVSRFADLNDPFELLAVNLKNPDYRRAFRAMRDKLNESRGLICFAKSWQNPVLWGHYADRHTGVALGFEIADHLPISAIYAKRPEKIPVDAATGAPIVGEALAGRLLRTKFADWKYEDEWRIFVSLDHETKEAGLYFYDYSADLRLDEVVLGPRCAIPVEKMATLVSTFDPKVRVKKSRIAFQSFRVVEDKSKRVSTA